MRSEFFQKIIEKLDSFFRRNLFSKIFDGLLNTISYTILSFFSLSVLEFLFNLSSLVRTLFFFIWFIPSFYLLVVEVIIPFLKYFNIIPSRNYFELAKHAGNFFPQVKDELVNSLQLVSNTNFSNFYSVKLIDEAFKKVYSKIDNLDFDSLIDFKPLYKKSIKTLAFITILILLFSLNSGLISASNRILNFNTEFLPPQEFYFDISPGNYQIPKGSSVELNINVIGKQLQEIFLMIKNIEESEYRKISLQKDSTGSFSYKISNAIKTFDYYTFAEDVESNVYRIEVTDFPVIKTFKIKITPPYYSKIPSSEQFDNGNISALKGSLVEIEVFASKELNEAFILFDDSSKTNLKISKLNASGKFQIRKDASYYILIKDQMNNFNEQPITYSIKALNDEIPIIELLSPESDFDLGEDNRIPLYAKIQDDYGFSKLILHYNRYSLLQKNDINNFNSIEISVDKTLKEQFINYIWNITPLMPSVNEIFSFYLEIYDNDLISGPKSSKTKTISFRIPTLEELFSKANNKQDDIQKELEETFKEAQELKRDLEQINKEMKKDKKELSWEEKQRLEKALDKFENLQEKMQKIADKIKEVQNDLQKNKLLSKETLEKYLQLQELLSEMTSDEMKKAVEKLRQNLEQMNRMLTQQQLQEFQFDEERLRKSIERTLNLLKRIQIEQKIDELLKRTEEISKSIEDLKNQLEKNSLDSKGKEEQIKKQDDITSDLENLEKSIEDLKEKMEGMRDVPYDDVERLKEEFEKQENQKLSKEISNKMKQNQIQSAKQNQQKLSSNMQQMLQMIQHIKDAMIQENQIQTFTDMMRLTENLITLSKRQESLKNKTQNMELNSSQLNSSAKEQQEIRNNLNNIIEQLSELSQKTFAITPEMGKALGNAIRNMEQSISSLQNRNPYGSANQQKEAMGNMNQAIIFLKNQMESMMQGEGSGQGGMMSLMQQLQQLSEQQMNLNNLTQMLRQMQDGQLTLQQQAELQRLAQQQELIKKSLEQLNKEAQESGISKRLPLNLDNLSKQMEEVITQMRTQRLDDELIQKQERILSKLLDAQKSINERDFEQERQSETGKDIVRKSPKMINIKENSEIEKIKQQLNNLIREGFNKDYEELIKKYFQLLQSEDNFN